MAQFRSSGLGLGGYGGTAEISGLSYTDEFPSGAEEAELIGAIDAREWDTRSLGRRVQQYGTFYDYKLRTIGSKGETFPEWLSDLGARAWEEIGQIGDVFNQCIINEYVPGQGIGFHSDHPRFGPVVATVSLGCDIDMDFRYGERSEVLRLEARSLLGLSGEARYKWQHGITGRAYDLVGGVKVPRERRVSVTFRTVE